MKAWAGVTDTDWYRFLSTRPHVDEVNFWQPSGGRQFRSLGPGELFLLKLWGERPGETAGLRPPRIG